MSKVPESPEQLKKILFGVIANLPALVEYEKVKATLMRQRYLALLKEGFTEQQALFLTKEGP